MDSDHEKAGNETKRRRISKSSSDEKKTTYVETTDDIHHALKEDANPVISLFSNAKTPLDPSSSQLLRDLLDPMSCDVFLRQCFRKRAVHISSKHGPKRIQNLVDEYMYSLDVHEILNNTSSDNIFVWLTTSSNSNQSNHNKQQENQPSKIRSIEVADATTAHALHSISGHATYCRAPPDLEQPLVATMLRCTGMGCGQYDPSGKSSVVLGRGEVEVFVAGSSGHCTDWHTDFQENFTIQLSGSKKWTLRKGRVQHPLRGCTPHYQSPDVVESQLKSARLSNPNFIFGRQDLESNATGIERTVILHPGDVLYHPAGIWHKVETMEGGSSVSINVSLMAMNYASVVCQSLQHVLLKDDRWREAIVSSSVSGDNGGGDVDKKLRGLLKDLPEIVKQFASNGGSQFILPPVLRHPPSFESIKNEENVAKNKDDEDDKEDGEDEKPSPQTSWIDNDDDDDNSDSDENKFNIIDVKEFQGPKGWIHEKTRDARLMKNPLASLMPMNDITDYYSRNLEQDEKNNNDLFVLNISYGGNDAQESTIRVILRDTSEEKMLNICCRCEKLGLDPSTRFQCGMLQELEERTKSVALEDPPLCLFYYGYFQWVPIKEEESCSTLDKQA